MRSMVYLLKLVPIRGNVNKGNSGSTFTIYAQYSMEKSILISCRTNGIL